MERRALVVALALTIPLALYGIPYAYAATTSSYAKPATIVIHQSCTPFACINSFADAQVNCDSGDYLTGLGGYSGSAPTKIEPTTGGTTSANDLTNEYQANGIYFLWDPAAPNMGPVVWIVCQHPVTIAGIGVPEFGSLYVAIALGAVVYFMLSRRLTEEPTTSTRFAA